MRSQQMIQFHKAGITKELCRERAAHGGKLRRRGKYEVLVTSRPSDRGIADLVISWGRIYPELRRNHRLTIPELHDCGHMKNMLVVAGKKECFVALDRSPESAAELVLLIAGIKAYKRRRGASEFTVAEKIKRAAMPLIRTRLGHDVHDRAASPPGLRAVTTRLRAEFLHHLIRKLVRRAIASHGLSEKSVVVVASIHQEAVVIATDSAIRKIAV